MQMFKKALTARTAILAAAVVVILLAQAPFFKTHTNIDYDTGSVVSAIDHCLVMPGQFDVDRVPGSPSYILVSAAFIFWFRKLAGAVGSREILWGASVVMSWLCLFTFYRRSKQVVGNYWVQGLMLLALGLHPIFFWHTFSAIEDMFAFFCFALTLSMLRRPGLDRLAWIIFATGVSSKLSLFGLFPLALAFHLRQDRGTDLLSLGRQIVEPVMIVVLTSVLLILPAAAHFAMDPAQMFYTDNYGTVFSQRFEVGWFLTRATILWWVPFGVYLIVEHIIRWVKERKVSLIEMADIPILLVFVACLKPMFVLNWIIAAVSLIVIALYYLKARGNADREFQFAKAFLITFSIPLSIVFIMLASYSRSFVLFALVPLLYGMSLRCRSVAVWVLIAAISFLSMFHYVQVTGRRVVIHQFGYYEAFLKGMNNYFNDYGFVDDAARQTEIPLLPVRGDN
ncbi:MAG: hypothetical protein WCO69_03145 [Candidatus Omnitrophota bacterium]